MGAKISRIGKNKAIRTSSEITVQNWLICDILYVSSRAVWEGNITSVTISIYCFVKTATSKFSFAKRLMLKYPLWRK